MGHFAHGTALKLGDGASPEVFTEIAEVTNISGPGMSLDTVEVTAHDSTDYTREFIAGLKDYGEVSIEGNFLPAGGTHDISTGMLKKYEDRTITNFQLVMVDAAPTTWTFAALVTSFEPSYPYDDKAGFSATFKITSKPTLA